MNYYALTYKTADNYLAEREKYRTAHLQLATEYVLKGLLVLGGVMENPADEALLIFKAETDEVAISFAENDPYVQHKLVVSWSVRKWNVVVNGFERNV
ncbi:YciI-like protein [Joostella sp. CR20]|uniref:YciI-like protein n=1 Tax=Joostella sp. CR20 TaxID=2804312 RepID=UPI00313C94E5